jgi:hypothetical protein
MKTKILIALTLILSLTSCHFVSPDADEEDANIDVLVGNGETPMWNIR